MIDWKNEQVMRIYAFAAFIGTRPNKLWEWRQRFPEFDELIEGPCHARYVPVMRAQKVLLEKGLIKAIRRPRDPFRGPRRQK